MARALLNGPPVNGSEMREVKSVCCDCGADFEVSIATEGDRITGVRDDRDPRVSYRVQQGFVIPSHRRT